MTDDTTLREALRAAQALATCCMAPGCYSHDELVEMARATKPTIDAALTPPAPAQPDDVVERVAQWLHDEGGFDETYNGTWPEHADDTGQREGGFVRLVPSDVQAKFRDVARRLVMDRQTLAALSAIQPTLDEAGR